MKLKHRLHQRDQVCSGTNRNPIQLGHGLRQREKRKIQRDNLNRVGDHRSIEIAKIDPFQIHDVRMLPQRSQQLPVTGVNRVDTSRSVLQQNLGEAACRSAGIESNSARDRNSKRCDCSLEFRFTAQQYRPPECDPRVRAHDGSRISYRETVDEDVSGSDDVLRLAYFWI
jgi:hypothetical protein